MDQWESARIFLEIFDWVGPRSGDPAQIHFHDDQLRVAHCEKLVIWKLAVGGQEFEPVIVITKLQAGLFALLSAFIELLGCLLPNVRRLTELFGNPRAN